METCDSEGSALGEGQRLRIVALMLLGLYFLGWLGLGTYETTRIRGDGIAEIVVSAVVLAGLAALGWRRPVIAGVLLILPGAFPIGLAIASFAVSEPFSGQPMAWLKALTSDHGSQVTLAFGFFFAVPAAIGLLFVVAGVKRWNMQHRLRSG